MLVGRAEEAELRIDDRSISREHARLVVNDGEVRISDLGSRNGTTVNGQRLEAARQLIPGDVITLGTVTLVLHGGGHARPERTPLSLEQLRRRVAEELGRALHYERPTAVAALELAQPPTRPADVLDAAHAALRPHDVLGWAPPAQLLVLLPELGGDEALDGVQELLRRVAERTGAAVRAGLASCPADGADAETLLSTARMAAAAAAPGTVGTGAHLVTRMTLREHRLVLADPAMHRLYALIQRLAASELPVLVTGETGTGKELAAAAVHSLVARAARARSWRSTARRCPRRSWRASCSATSAAPSPARRARSPACSRRRSGGTRVPRRDRRALASRRRRSCCARSRPSGSPGWATCASAASTSASSRRPTATCEAEVRAGRFRAGPLLPPQRRPPWCCPPLRDRPREIPILARAFLDEACARAERAPHRPLRRRAAVLVAARLARQRARAAQRDGRRAPPLGGRRCSRPGTCPSEASAPPRLRRRRPLPGARGLAPRLPRCPRAPADRGGDARAGAPPDGGGARGGGGCRSTRRSCIGMPLRTFVLKVKQYGLRTREPGSTHDATLLREPPAGRRPRSSTSTGWCARSAAARWARSTSRTTRCSTGPWR